MSNAHRLPVLLDALLEEWGCCIWVEKDMWEENDCVEIGHWKTSCGKNFTFPDEGKPSKHGFEYCPYCGKDIEEKA